MSCETLNPEAPALKQTRASLAVWDRLWSDKPSDTKDRALIERERRSSRWAMIVDRLETTFGSIRGLRTVELGSGRGDLSVLLARCGADVTLLDASRKALDQARCRFDRLGLSASFKQDDMLGTLGGLRARFDCALSSGVIEHFRGDDRTRAVRAHYEVLLPGGLAVISAPNAWCVPYRLWKRYLELRGWWPYGLELPYSKRELVSRAREAGFARVEAKCMDFRRSLSFGRLKSSGPFRRSQRTPLLDGIFGLILLLFCWRSP